MIANIYVQECGDVTCNVSVLWLFFGSNGLAVIFGSTYH